MKEAKQNYFSDLAIPPGEYMLEVAVEHDLNQADLAALMGLSAPDISELATGIKVITPEIALQLERVLGVPAHVWKGLETNYRKMRV